MYDHTDEEVVCSHRGAKKEKAYYLWSIAKNSKCLKRNSSRMRTENYIEGQRCDAQPGFILPAHTKSIVTITVASFALIFAMPVYAAQQWHSGVQITKVYPRADGTVVLTFDSDSTHCPTPQAPSTTSSKPGRAR